MQYLNDLVFLDFEASSLPDTAGWPIEVGLSWVTDDGEIETHSRLIRRWPDWSMDAWSAQSAAVHGIPYEVLEQEGWEAPEVATWYLDLTKGRRIGSDAPDYDTAWLQRLLETTTMGSFAVNREIGKIGDSYTLIEPLLSSAALDRYHERLARIRAPHRAGPDSARHAKALRVAMDSR
ncbi:hypothetical protein CLV79_10926 [Limimaricola soesokkakensis]|uniref:Exonuclease n=1 Tax=Limimaricola soesokkakensis TaxID=1343159 RepID=A0A1X6ZSS6_9RHOB|nr:hypothetical protein [Limimaricola soesokkakensis]PSK84054.1 hypothetical protein CLV79_10926 [Limimaricola soesokkakensis]SLN59757.1 hypothetical protein LOS8367_02872 [Limimaricola soesokkakensis]